MASVDKFGKTVDLAVAEALKELGITREEAEIEVLVEGSKGFLGIGSRNAYVRVTAKEEKAAAPATEVTEAPVAPPAQPVATAEETPAEEEAETDAHLAAAEEKAKEFLAQVFRAMDLDVEMEAQETDRGLALEFTGENMGLLIGKRGQTLDALQYLTNLVVNKGSEGYMSVTLDTENYRARRKETLENLAKNLAKKVKYTKRSVTLEPMNPYERRIIHSALQGDKYVTTYSEGEEPYRYVVITLKR